MRHLTISDTTGLPDDFGPFSIVDAEQFFKEIAKGMAFNAAMTASLRAQFEPIRNALQNQIAETIVPARDFSEFASLLIEKTIQAKK